MAAYAKALACEYQATKWKDLNLIQRVTFFLFMSCFVSMKLDATPSYLSVHLFGSFGCNKPHNLSSTAARIMRGNVDQDTHIPHKSAVIQLIAVNIYVSFPRRNLNGVTQQHKISDQYMHQD